SPRAPRLFHLRTAARYADDVQRHRRARARRTRLVCTVRSADTLPRHHRLPEVGGQSGGAGPHRRRAAYATLAGAAKEAAEDLPPASDDVRGTDPPTHAGHVG